MRHRQPTVNFRAAFTLIELLVVIAIIAILSVVVILTLNPAELLRQNRDANRLSDLATMNSALGIYAEDTGASMGSPFTSYISIPDPSAAGVNGCPNLGLPAQGTGWVYQCASSTTYRNVNGSGWIPLNFTNISSNAPFGGLPQDPINQTSSNLFYTYTTDGKTYEVTATLESQKYRSQINLSPSISTYPGVAALGTNLALSGLWNPNGLVGYWNFEEGSGSSTIDQSGNGNTGDWAGTPTGNNGTYYIGGKVGKFAGNFDGSTDDVTISDSSVIDGLGRSGTSYSVGLWFKTSATGYSSLTEKWPGGVSPYPWAFRIWSGGALAFNIYDGTHNPSANTLGPINDNAWHYAVGVRNAGTSQVLLYIDGTLKSSVVDTTVGDISTSGSFPIGARYSGSNPGNSGNYFSGVIDDVRIYNRALSPAEIQALYNAQK